MSAKFIQRIKITAIYIKSVYTKN